MTDQEKVKKDDLILQAIEAYDAQLEQDSTLAMKAAFQHIQDLGLWSEMKSKYPDLYDYAKELLGEKTEPTVQDDGLSEAEQALMDLFRQLTPDQQDMVIRIVQAAADKMGSLLPRMIANSSFSRFVISPAPSKNNSIAIIEQLFYNCNTPKKKFVRSSRIK